MSELNIPLIKREIDAFTMSGAGESYNFSIIPRDPTKPRAYLGWSGLGDRCIRAVFYKYRKCCKPDFPPRILRLFRRGDREEYVFVFLLRAIGMEIHDVDENGEQFEVSDLEGNLKGHFDGVGTAPEKFWIEGQPIPFLLEFKTYNDSRFKKLLKLGLKKADIKYYVQIQGYMGQEGLEGCLFGAVNKNDDSLHFIWIKYNRLEYESAMDRAQDILEATEPPERIQNKPTDRECKFCDAYDICFKKKASIKSCYSCKFARPGPEQSWTCLKKQEFGTVCKKYSDIAH